MRRRARAASLALVALAAAGALALLAYFNASQWAANATLAPISKNLNQSLYPLAKAWYQYSGPYNVTYYYVKFKPGWPETYTVGIFAARDAGWQTRLEVVGRSGNPGGTYTISLGNVQQIGNTQNAGSYAPAPAPLVWSMATTGRYSILATAQFNKGGIYAVQLVNFTAEPMSKLTSWSFSCPGHTYTQQYTCAGGTYTATLPSYSDSLAYSSKPTYIDEYAVYSSTYLAVSPVRYTGSSIRTQIDARSSTDWGLSSAIYRVADRWGLVVAAGATVQVSGAYALSGDTRNNVAYLSVGVDENGDGVADVEYIAYVYDTAQGNGLIVSIFINRGSSVASINSQGDPTTTPPPQYRLTKVSSVTSGNSFTISITLPTTQVGRIVGIAFVVVDASGAASGSPSGDFWVDWQNFAITVVAPACDPGLRVWELGSYRTDVFVRTDSWRLVTQVDARGSSGTPSTDYGVAAAFIDYKFNATGAQISVGVRYIRGGNEARNNVVYVDVAVDVDYDGSADREYIYYYYDTVDYNGIIVSPFTQQVVCTVDSAGACTPSGTRYVATRLGSITPGDYAFTITLTAQGAVTSVALVVTDASYADSDGTLGDFAVEWGPVTVQSYSCPLPAGWYSNTAPGAYVWQTNYALFVANGATAYTQLVQGALTYVANFTGKGKYVALTSALGEAFGLYLRGASAGCVYGYYSPSSRWVELRPLAALGDVIVRDSAGGPLARFGCAAPPAAQYIGFRAGPGEYLIVRTVEAWG
ncbi:hypothetical protein [Pyrobaculum calidifontis]|uniref:Uncharacterized protein n=1 Tax=Pyrobaculum calidifontis (strain DSM 21063 / JCM 11548 / VA1) TaxID=410359 RepID=A3MUL2_PYRCJ|nr:hypothetical protein [Pyrobaculum calidifontis]ABO08329.1 conserved hypothetical protein [Pyrobaculum calidifontis JCM 11548]